MTGGRWEKVLGGRQLKHYPDILDYKGSKDIKISNRL